MAINLLKNAKETQAFGAGTTIFSEGDDPGGLMYFVQSGEVDILVHGERIETLGEGALLGEIGLVDKKPRSATALAKSDCRLVPINERRFAYLVHDTPLFALQVMQTIAARLRSYRGT